MYRLAEGQMAKFILIDQSIKGLGGHYLEYATHVLNAAEKQGFDACIATNSEFNGNVKFKCFATYKYDIWGESNFKIKSKNIYRKTIGTIKKTARPLVKVLSCIKFFLKNMLSPIKKCMGKCKRGLRRRTSLRLAEVYFSDWGYFVEAVREGKPTLILRINIFKLAAMTIVLGILGVLALIAKIVRKILNCICNVSRKIKSTYRTLCVSTHRHMWKASFRRNTQKVLTHYNVTKDDIVFIPTLSNVDLMGLKQLIKRNRHAREVSWHLVFRRNLFIGREPDYKKYEKDKDELREVTYECAIKDVYKRMYFYTDTEKLTSQYELMHTVEFTTLPIPVNPKLEEENIKNEKPINIIYLGDARREKGYQELPKIVDSLWDPYVEKNKIHFEFQSNFSFTNMDANCDIVAAREYMDSLPQEHIKLYKEPLSSDEYLSLAKSGDIALLFYDRDNYYARSSGALVECLIAGIPVIVPSGSWLSEQICKDNYCHLSEMKRQLKQRQAYLGAELEWENKNLDLAINPMQENFLSFGQGENAAFTDFEVPTDANVLFISYSVNSILQKGNYVKTQILSVDENEKTGMVYFESDDYGTNLDETKVFVAWNIPADIKKIRISFSNAFGKNAISITNLEITFSYSIDKCIVGKYGIVFSRYEDVPMLLSNMIDYYSYYKLSAKQKAKEYRQIHNAQKLVSYLYNNAKDGAGICQ